MGEENTALTRVGQHATDATSLIQIRHNDKTQVKDTFKQNENHNVTMNTAQQETIKYKLRPSTTQT